MLYANDSFMWLIVILFIVFILLVAPLLSGEGLKQKRVLIPFFTSLMMLPVLILISWDHVRVIDHDGVSIVSFGERQEATWEEVDHVVVEPLSGGIQVRLMCPLREQHYLPSMLWSNQETCTRLITLALTMIR
ncbi:hypothetical protein [Geomicrobium sediminis]|uniref:Uncharacterized protein n=1 Tax=Geomicrobium sediminis TaxID=1347788 RepID=A0ABS2PCG9_9BACL|nr:hypothetical protein [Geomicrobium sediminis]MBM7633123.1 hypothetical protein [Geomicrobium sediminis]